MTIIEAIKSGKRFRIKGGTWLLVTSGHIVAEFPDRHDPYFLTAENILADYEVEDESITITRSQLKEALEACVISNLMPPLKIKQIAEELGFKS